MLFKKNKVEWLKGHAAFTGPTAIDVAGKAYTPRTSSSPPARR
jgi:dihydrolipoamide dehydrogenase